MSKDNEIYKKALDYYHNGDIEKAISVCERLGEEIALSSNILNFKGLLHYLKGEMNDARKLWNLNYEKNKDEISKKYLLDSKKDEDYAILFIEALQHIKELQISNAIEKLEVCKEKTNYNSINVNNELAKCYMKKGKYKKVMECIEVVLNLDKKNPIALENRKTLISLGIIKDKSNKKLYIGLSIILILLCGGLFYKFGILDKNNISKKNVNNTNMAKKTVENDKNKNELNKNELNNKDNKVTEDKSKNSTEEKEDEVKNKEDEKNKDKSKEQIDEKKVFPSQNLRSAIDNKEYDKIYTILQEYKLENLNINDKVIFNEAKNLMENKAGEYYYFKGRDFAKNNKFNEAIECYKKGINYGKGIFPYEDSLYILGVSYNKVGNTEEALRIYEKYYKEYKDKSYVKKGTYIKDVMYYLRDTYKNLDDNKFKVYEEELKKLD